ncbi:MAG TPA: STT3 domain-containing protein [Thermoanaerobaculia bacterium]|nr:STT3 domain-containing protein [Thermoanaerobaculia bacterium]
MSRRIVYALGLCAAAVIGIALRLHTRDQAAYAGGVHPLDSDSAYHMRRARFAAESFPRTIQMDPLMNFPDGGVAIWPPLFDLALALPARIAHGAAASKGEVERGAAWVPVALAAGAILLAGALGRRVHDPWSGLALALFVAVCPGHVLWTQYAHTDQHVAESLCGLLALVAFLASRARPDEPGQAARETAAGLALALAVLAWQGAIYWGAIFALSLLLESVAARRSVAGAAARTLGVAAVVSGGATLAFLGWVRPPVTYVSFGLFQPLFLAALAGGTAALTAAIRAARGLSERRELAARNAAGPEGRREAAAKAAPAVDRRELVVSAALAAAAAAVALPFLPQLAGGLVRGVGYVAGATSEVAGAGGYVSYPRDWLKGIYEARPLLADGPGLALRLLSAAFFASPVAIAIWAVRARRGERPGVHCALAVWGAVTIFLALSQRLNVYYAAPLAGLTALELVRAVCDRARRKGLTPFASTGLAALLGFGMLWPMGRGLRDELSAVYAPGSDLFETLGRMRTELPHAIDPYDPGLLGPPPFPAALDGARSVMAPWSLGHFVLYEAGLPVVANNFGYGFMDSIRFFLSESEDEAVAIARRHRARWVVATDITPRINDYARYLGRPPYLVAGPGGLEPSPAYLRTLQARLYELGGREGRFADVAVPALSAFRLRFRSQTAIQRGGRWIPRWSVWEIAD